MVPWGYAPWSGRCSAWRACLLCAYSPGADERLSHEPVQSTEGRGRRPEGLHHTTIFRWYRATMV